MSVIAEDEKNLCDITYMNIHLISIARMCETTLVPTQNIKYYQTIFFNSIIQNILQNKDFKVIEARRTLKRRAWSSYSINAISLEPLLLLSLPCCSGIGERLRLKLG
jgi:hypothetical protein